MHPDFGEIWLLFETRFKDSYVGKLGWGVMYLSGTKIGSCLLIIEDLSDLTLTSLVFDMFMISSRITHYGMNHLFEAISYLMRIAILAIKLPRSGSSCPEKLVWLSEKNGKLFSVKAAYNGLTSSLTPT
ncbi:hypothetical protein IFM89_006437 [Coptis chinensis]|uniref:Uncharacterized protein n=1 Tax=Coptis chinensis TaxID=261450 RepID=A0A835HU95_9MAGN|nr:hypothetical protein IFM89_006437 [Coptis chinensis]